MSNPVLVSAKISPVRTFASDLAQVRSKDIKVSTTKVIEVEPKSLKKTQPVQQNIKPASAVLPKSHPTAEAVIPPFHTFSKPTAHSVPSQSITKIDTSEVEAAHRKVSPSTLTTPSNGVSVGDDALVDAKATVITDTKNKRFTLTDAVSDSITIWYKSKKDQLSGKNVPKYTLPEAQRRKGIIQKATSQTGRMTTADHAAVLQKLRTAKSQIPAVKPNLIPPKTTKEIPVWETAQDSFSVSSEADATAILQIPPIDVNESIFIKTISPAIPTKENPLPKDITPLTVIPVIKHSSLNQLSVTQNDQQLFTQPKENISKVTLQKPSLEKKLTLPREIISPIIPIKENDQEAVTNIKNVVPDLERIPTEPEIRPIEALKPALRIVPIIPAIQKPVPEIISSGLTDAPKEMPVLPVASLEQKKIIPMIPRVENHVNTNEQNNPIVIISKPVENLISVQNTATREQPVFQKLSTPSPQLQQSIFASPRYVYILLAGLLVLSSMGIFYWYFLKTNELNPITSTRTITDIPELAVVTIPSSVLVTTSADIINALSSQMADDTTRTEITLLSTTTGAPLSPAEFFAAFKITLPISFVSSINQIRFGMYRGLPWILLVISDAPTGQGGMFAWEETLTQDLNPWFSTNGTTARKVNNTFTDSIIDSHDVRLNKDNLGMYLVVYGFINSNEILITPNDTSWLNLGQKLNSGL